MGEPSGSNVALMSRADVLVAELETILNFISILDTETDKVERKEIKCEFEKVFDNLEDLHINNA